MTGLQDRPNTSWAEQDLSHWPGPVEETYLEEFTRWVTSYSKPLEDLRKATISFSSNFDEFISVGKVHYFEFAPVPMANPFKPVKTKLPYTKPVNTGPRPKNQYDKRGRRRF